MKQGTRFAKVRKTYWAHTLSMVFVALALILPLKMGLVYLPARNYHVVAYYVLSVAFILAAQFSYLKPLKRTAITNKVGYVVGMSVFILIIVIWIGQHDSRTLDFSELEHGEILGPLMMALGLPVVQAFVNFTYTDTADPDE